jgi:hypothetical protein
MHRKLPVVLLSAFALAAPGAMAYGNEKGKDKTKGKSEQKSGDRRGGVHDGDHRDGDHGGDAKITICHVPSGNRSARHTISVGESAWAAHQAHGDYRGACGPARTRRTRRVSDAGTDPGGTRFLSRGEASRY